MWTKRAETESDTSREVNCSRDKTFAKGSELLNFEYWILVKCMKKKSAIWMAWWHNNKLLNYKQTGKKCTLNFHFPSPNRVEQKEAAKIVWCTELNKQIVLSYATSVLQGLEQNIKIQPTSGLSFTYCWVRPKTACRILLWLFSLA